MNFNRRYPDHVIEMSASATTVDGKVKVEVTDADEDSDASSEPVFDHKAAGPQFKVKSSKVGVRSNDNNIS